MFVGYVAIDSMANEAQNKLEFNIKARKENRNRQTNSRHITVKRVNHKLYINAGSDRRRFLCASTFPEELPWLAAHLRRPSSAVHLALAAHTWHTLLLFV